MRGSRFLNYLIFMDLRTSDGPKAALMESYSVNFIGYYLPFLNGAYYLDFNCLLVRSLIQSGAVFSMDVKA